MSESAKLESQQLWLIKMIQKSSGNAKVRLLAIFDILADLTDAPIDKENFTLDKLCHEQSQVLLDYLTSEAKATGADIPEILAQQIAQLARQALQEYAASMDKTCFVHAQITARALLKSYTHRDHKKTYLLASIAGVFVCASLYFSVLGHFFQGSGADKTPIKLAKNDTTSAKPKELTPDADVRIAPNFELGPDTKAAMYAHLEQMRHGDCQYPEAIQIPDKDKKIYLENVVGGEVPNTPEEMEIVNKYLQKVRCNYTPMLMKNSKN